jgi:hypothetical protein
MNFCPNCGQPVDPNTGRCPVCSEKQSPEQYPTADYTQYNTLDNYGGNFTSFLKKRLSSPVFLWFCILLTVMMVSAIAVYVIEGVNMPRMLELQLSVTGQNISAAEIKNVTNTTLTMMVIFGIPLLVYAVVMAVSFWKTYLGAKRQSLDMPLGGLKAISVLITIERVLIWICVGILALGTIVMFAAPSLMARELSGTDYEIFLVFFYVYAVIFVIMTIVLILINIFYYGSIKKATVSVINSFKFNENRLEKMSTVRVWLIVFGVLSALSALGVLSAIPMFSAITSAPEFSEIPFNIFGVVPITLMATAGASTLLTVALYFLGAAIANSLNIPKQIPPAAYIYNNK